LTRLLWTFGWTVSVLAAPLNYQTIFGSQASVTASAVDSAGNVYVTGWTTSPQLPVTPNAFQKSFAQTTCGYNTIPGEHGSPGQSFPVPCAHSFIAKIDSSGTGLVYLTYLGGEGNDAAQAIALDAAGNVYVTGSTTSTTFPVTLFAFRPSPGRGFVAKLNADGSSLAFSTYLDGGEGTAIAVDSSAAVYVTGTADQAEFSTTPGAFQSMRYLGHSDVFVLKLNRFGTNLLYSTLLGGTFDDVPSAIAVDEGGNGYVGGYTASVPAYSHPMASDEFAPFPTTPGAVYQPGDRVDVFVTKTNSSGSALVYSTLLGGSGFDTLKGLAIDPIGNAYFAGYGSSDFPVTPGAFDSGYSGGFAAKLSPDGAKLLYSTRLGGVRLDSAGLVAIDSAGNAFITGLSVNPRFPITPDSLMPCFPETDPTYYRPWPFIAELNSSGSKFAYSSFLKAGAVAIDSSGNVYLPAENAILERANITAAPVAGLRCVTNAASFWSNGITPGELVSLFGSGIGPDNAGTLQRDASGNVATELAGTRVLFNGFPAPLLYVSKGQINAVVPFELAGSTHASVQVLRNGVNSNALDVPIRDAAPAVFTLDAFGQAAVLNEDGSLNSVWNPAKQGSTISIFATGAGLLDPIPANGRVPSAPSAKPVLPVRVVIDVSDAEVLYAGDAPGIVEGVVQINARVPKVFNTGTVNLSLQIGDHAFPIDVQTTVAVR
jgi:uncharacterized protein (TIGR03437 family)